MYTYGRVYVRLVCFYVFMLVCMYVCMYVCMCVCVLLALPFLPPDNIVKAFEEIIEQHIDENCHDNLLVFVQYYRSQWIESLSFPLRSWSVYKEVIRTNNDTEG